MTTTRQQVPTRPTPTSDVTTGATGRITFEETPFIIGAAAVGGVLIAVAVLLLVVVVVIM